MDVVVGSGALAAALARATGAGLCSADPVSGPFLWRRVAVDSGQGVRAALVGASRVVALLDEGPAHGLLAVLAQLPPTPGVWVVPPGSALSPALAGTRPGWPILPIAGVLGPQEPLVDRWTAIVGAGRHLWEADPGPLHAADAGEAVDAVRAALDGDIRPVVSRPFRLPALADRIARAVGRPLRASRVPFRLAMWAIGLGGADVRRRFADRRD